MHLFINSSSCFNALQTEMGALMTDTLLLTKPTIFTIWRYRNKSWLWAREMTPRLRMNAALAEDPSSLPSTYTAAHDHLTAAQGIWALPWPHQPLRHLHTRGAHKFTQARTHILIFFLIFNSFHVRCLPREAACTPGCIQTTNPDLCYKITKG